MVFVHCSSAAQYARSVRAAFSILDFGDMDSQKWLIYASHKFFPLSLGYRLEGVKLRREERRLSRYFDTCTATTRAEYDTLNSISQHDRTDWFPNGVDVDFFAPAETRPDPDTICFVGRMDYFPNQLGVLKFCREILPGLRSVRPNLKFLIVGAEPSTKIRRLEQQPGVRVTGTVPDVRPYVQRAVLTVAPLSIARGTQNKVLESMAQGVPVVCSPEVAQGVDAVAGEHLLVANSAREYGAAILKLLTDEEMRSSLAAAARQRVMSHHQWSSSMTRLDKIIENTMRSVGAAR